MMLIGICGFFPPSKQTTVWRTPYVAIPYIVEILSSYIVDLNRETLRGKKDLVTKICVHLLELITIYLDREK